MPRTRFSAPPRRLHGLIVVNGLLLLLLGAVSFAPRGMAQGRPRGDYTMAAGKIKGAVSNAVYVVDTKNQELMALAYEPNKRELIGVGYRNLAVDAASVRRRGRDR